MERTMRVLVIVLSITTSGCDTPSMPRAEITHVRLQENQNRYQLLFELNTVAFWEVEASDQTDDFAAFFTIAQSQPRSKDVGLINTGPLELNRGEDYIIRILAYTLEDLQAGRAAMAYSYIDKQ